MTRQEPQKNLRPKVAGFICNWGAYSGIEMAGIHQSEYSASVKLVKVMCLGRLHLGHILKAFELGADGVMMLGCAAPDCHYGTGMVEAKELLIQARKILRLLGIDQKRLVLLEIPPGRDDIFIKRVSAFIEFTKKSGSISPVSNTKIGSSSY